MAAIAERIIHGRSYKVFACYRCGKDQLDYEVTGIGDREYCIYPDCTPRVRVYWQWGRLHVWLKPWLPRSFWGA